MELCCRNWGEDELSIDGYSVYGGDVRAIYDLMNDRRKEGLVSFLEEASGRSEQGLLFDLEDDPGRLLDDMGVLVQEGRLYKKWRKNINGKERQFGVPAPVLDEFLREFVIPLVGSFSVHEKAHGGEKDWGVRRSLGEHVDGKMFFSLDLKDAFRNVRYRHLLSMLYDNLEGLGHDDRLFCSAFLGSLMTTSYDGSGCRGELPQGAGHSMRVFNRCLLGLDNYLDGRCKERGFRYTRWVDDITISSCEEDEEDRFLGAVKLVEENFPVSRSKLFFQRGESDVYLLGQVISGGKIFKNSREERRAHKCSLLDYDFYFGERYGREIEEW